MTARRAGPARALLGRAVLLTLVTGAAATVFAALTRGADGVLAALLGLALVLGFLLVGQLPVAQVARGRNRLGTALLVMIYTLRLMVVLLAFRASLVSDAVDRDVLGLTVIGCGLAWTAGAVWSALGWRPMVVEPEEQVVPDAVVDQRW